MQSGSSSANLRKRTFIYSQNKCFNDRKNVDYFSGTHFIDHGIALKIVQQHKGPVVCNQVKYKESLTGKHTDILVCFPM